MSSTVIDGTRMLSCDDCEKVVALGITVREDAFIRAIIQCPECYAKEHNIVKETTNV